MHFANAPLLAAMSIKFEIQWPRFIISMVILAAMVAGAAAFEMTTSSNDKKKKEQELLRTLAENTLAARGLDRPSPSTEELKQ